MNRHFYEQTFYNLGLNGSLVTNHEDEKTQNCSCCQGRVEMKLPVIWTPDPVVNFPFVLKEDKAWN